MTHRPIFAKDTELFRWGPIPGRFGYVSMFVEVHYKHFHIKYPGENWSETLFLFKDKRMFWINDLEAVRRAGLNVFLHYLLPDQTREMVYTEWQETVVKLMNWMAKIKTTNLANVDDEYLHKLWTDLHAIYQEFWTTGSIPELANYGSDNFLESKLQPYTKNKMEILSLMEVLTAPERLSFYQEEEIDLLQTNDLSLHAQKYFWLKNSYAGTEVIPEKFFSERKATLSPNLLDEVNKKMQDVISNKQIAQKKYGLSVEIMNIARAISAGIGWQDERKKYVFQVLHYQDQIILEIARRFGYNPDELHDAWYYEISDIISGINLHDLLSRRATGFGFLFHKDCIELNAEDTKECWQIYSHENVEKDARILTGIMASKGSGKKIIGTVRIVLDPSKSGEFISNEILVAPMTSPEYIFAMRKASAIITDTGGLTSHAAIVSRELGIVCIVGTKIATHILKDGDQVEIDPNQGTVTKL